MPPTRAGRAGSCPCPFLLGSAHPSPAKPRGLSLPRFLVTPSQLCALLHAGLTCGAVKHHYPHCLGGPAKPRGRGWKQAGAPHSRAGSWAPRRAPTPKLTGNASPLRDKAAGHSPISPAQPRARPAITGARPNTRLTKPAPPCAAATAPRPASPPALGSRTRDAASPADTEPRRGRADVPTSHAQHPPCSRATRATGPAPPAPAGRRHRGSAGDVPVSQSSLAPPRSRAAQVSLP